MWISRKRYNELRDAKADNEVLHTDLDLWRAKYQALEEGTASMLHLADGTSVLVIRIDELEKANEEGRRAIESVNFLKTELDKYKQMYADEVQKRLDLLKYITEVRIDSNEISRSQTDT